MIHTIPESVHAILSPSKAHLWIHCKGGLAAARGMPNKASKYAAEGTAYHDVARRALVDGTDCANYIGNKYQVGEFTFTIDSDNADYAQVYVDAVRAIPGKRFVEVDLEYSALLGVPKFHDGVPVAAGTGDCVILDYEHKIIWGIDLKFGRGDIVYAKENPQVRLYLAAAVHRYEMLGITDDWKAIGAISQPRANHYDQETITVGELRAWVHAQRDAAMRAYTLWTMGPDRVDEFDLTPGDKQCRWCALSGNCVAQRNKILNLFPKGHAAKAIPTLVQLDEAQLAEALDGADELENFVHALYKEATARIHSGHVVPNWKAVTGRRGNRELDETATVTLDEVAATEAGIEDVEHGAVTLSVKDAVIIALDKAAYKPQELRTVAQLQKLLEKKAPLLWAAMQEHIKQTDGKPGIARIEDPRPPMALVSQEFPVTAGAATGLL
jgi:hypothetical protein